MKIRNLLVLTITTTLATLCAQGQARDGTRTFKDHLGQSISIGPFGTVRSFKDSQGRQTATNNTFRICPCGRKCIDSANRITSRDKLELHVDYPQQGTTLKEDETLMVTVKVSGPNLEVIRKLAWVAGSRVVNIDETISTTTDVSICNLRESGAGLLRNDPCPIPPRGRDSLLEREVYLVKCPDWMFTAEAAERFQITSSRPLRLRFGYQSR
ncbi:MAG: hypothetical protein JWM21_2938 [Acidobacteria bacterium]|nr:hypothetical protein [Acidobacteriota bacterium]